MTRKTALLALVSILTSRIASAQKKIDQIPARDSREIANSEILEQEVAFLPEETEIENFWEILERFAEDSGVKISKITPNQRRQGGRGKKKSAIVEIRSSKGGFKKVEEIVEVKGVGDALLERLRPHLTVSGKTTAKLL